uniref:Uncharacterized protein n=1 Tax=Candidatus Kentrum sp. SD TaxID=2126332 RepID=A0A450Y670_9GAMM|nr:MAG: hypothetical protein BECKSD772F_GA0070984_100913 [Candidatus Kentron sp. SD]VFK43072.1 MAG: hypothetical protein BECKSD772E_GA0070983_102213 [Candidatus Kentron sp. SD]VFK77728.1 MAG: hypothetical protein BECKSD772D_GA0070982_100157 [Candidatus Kentron sp. SD]
MYRKNMLARSNRLQTGCSLRGRRFFRDFYFRNINKILENRCICQDPPPVELGAKRE